MYTLDTMIKVNINTTLHEIIETVIAKTHN